MNRLSDDDFHKVLQRATSDRPDPREGHFTDDDELLTCLASGLLRPEEHRRLVEHLADCGECRRELAAMVRDGVLEFDPLATEAESPVEPVRPPETRRRFMRSTVLPLAVAAALLVCIGLLWRSAGKDEVDRVLAQSRQALESGDPLAALTRLESLPAEPLAPAAAWEAQRLAEEAGYRAAKARLEAGQFRAVAEIEGRVTKYAAVSPRLTNLRLQSHRGMAAELALARHGMLLDYGFELDGASPTMSLPVVDETTERLGREFREAVETYPDESTLWLNRGQFLLTMAQPQEARACFQRALESASDLLWAHVGLGLVAFELRETAAALEHFEAALRIDPDQLAAQLNAAVCLNVLGRQAEAAAYLRRIQPRIDDPLLLRRIEQSLSAAQPVEK
ncbi:MAG: tetratricopeptide repeat protein [Planctomycetes bacterium]|nr:tetratricopeptide repeat protein [Planctomycetota bacterium]